MSSKHPASEPRSTERSDRVAQANHVLAHLQAQLAELDRREQHLNQQLSTLLEQQRLTQREAERSQAKVLELNQLEAALLKDRADLELREAQLKAREDKLALQREQFSNDKSEFETSQTLREQAHRKASQELAERELRVGQQELETRRGHTELDKLQVEVQRSQQDCAATQTQLADEQSQLQIRIAEFEEQSAKANTSLSDRARAATDLDKELDLRLVTISAKEKELTQLQRDLKEKQDKLDQDRRSLKEEIGKEVLAEREGVVHALHQIKLQMTAHDNRVLEWEAKVKATEAAQADQLHALRKEKLSGLDQREKELQRREIDVEKRKVFHESHLDKVRIDLQRKKVELERERQQHRVWSEQVEQSIRMRLTHMRRFRDLVGQREQALQDEQIAFHKTRVSTETALAKLRERLLHERDTWTQQRSADLQRLTKRDQNLDQQFENIHKTRLELDQIRLELKSGLANFVESLPTSNDLNALEADQLEMSQHFHSLLQVVGRQCDELENAQLQFSKRQQKIREEGNALANWIQEKENHLEVCESQIQADVETLKLQEQLWQAARDQWNTDRLQAEAVIRELVIQLETALDEIANLQSDIGNEDLHAGEPEQRAVA